MEGSVTAQKMLPAGDWDQTAPEEPGTVKISLFCRYVLHTCHFRVNHCEHLFPVWSSSRVRQVLLISSSLLPSSGLRLELR